MCIYDTLYTIDTLWYQIEPFVTRTLFAFVVTLVWCLINYVRESGNTRLGWLRASIIAVTFSAILISLSVPEIAFRREVLAVLRAGTVPQVAGIASTPFSQPSSKADQVSVGPKLFTYGQSSVGFSRTRRAGGPQLNNKCVRISYIQTYIVKLEMGSRSCCPTTGQ